MSYEITEVIWGYTEQPSQFVYGEMPNPKPGELAPIRFSMALLRSPERNVLVDCGMNVGIPEKKAAMDSLNIQTSLPTEALALTGVKPKEISDVVLTHAHYDHMGAIELFPNAHFYLQCAELEGWEQVITRPKYASIIMPAVIPTDLTAARALVDEGRMTLLDGAVDDLLPGISVVPFAECHSIMDQVVVVDTPDGKYVLAGDLAVAPENMLGFEGFENYLAPIIGRSGSARCLFEAYDQILEMVQGDMGRLVFPHDNSMVERWPSEMVKPELGIVRIAG